MFGSKGVRPHCCRFRALVAAAPPCFAGDVFGLGWRHGFLALGWRLLRRNGFGLGWRYSSLGIGWRLLRRNVFGLGWRYSSLGIGWRLLRRNVFGLGWRYSSLGIGWRLLRRNVFGLGWRYSSLGIGWRLPRPPLRARRAAKKAVQALVICPFASPALLRHQCLFVITPRPRCCRSF